MLICALVATLVQPAGIALGFGAAILGALTAQASVARLTAPRVGFTS